MKTFSKPAIGVIALLCAAIVVLSILLYQKSLHPNSGALYYRAEAKELSITKDITYEDAIRCKRKYNDLKKGLILTTGKDPGKQLKDLQGWRLNLEKIKTLLDNPDVRELFLVPIMQPELDNNNMPSDTVISILIAGITPTPDDTGMVLFNKSSPSLFFEYLRPCPDNCPKNYYEILNDPEVK